MSNRIRTIWHKILCILNIHDYVNDNAGISSDFTIHRMNYYHCRYCPKFKLEHPFPVPVAFIKLALKQKTLFEHNLYKRKVLIEKVEKRNKLYENIDGLLYIDFRYNEAHYGV